MLYENEKIIFFIFVEFLIILYIFAYYAYFCAFLLYTIFFKCIRIRSLFIAIFYALYYYNEADWSFETRKLNYQATSNHVTHLTWSFEAKGWSYEGAINPLFYDLLCAYKRQGLVSSLIISAIDRTNLSYLYKLLYEVQRSFGIFVIEQWTGKKIIKIENRRTRILNKSVHITRDILILVSNILILELKSCAFTFSHFPRVFSFKTSQKAILLELIGRKIDASLP